ncbi:unnamed protein product, partial [Prorocentrum cordatum]
VNAPTVCPSPHIVAPRVPAGGGPRARAAGRLPVPGRGRRPGLGEPGGQLEPAPGGRPSPGQHQPLPGDPRAGRRRRGPLGSAPLAPGRGPGAPDPRAARRRRSWGLLRGRGGRRGSRRGGAALRGPRARAGRGAARRGRGGGAAAPARAAGVEPGRGVSHRGLPRLEPPRALRRRVAGAGGEHVQPRARRHVLPASGRAVRVPGGGGRSRWPAVRGGGSSSPGAAAARHRPGPPRGGVRSGRRRGGGTLRLPARILGGADRLVRGRRAHRPVPHCRLRRRLHACGRWRPPAHAPVTCVEAPACEAVMTGFLRGSGYTFTAAAVTALGAGAEATAGFDVPSLLAAAPPGPARVGDVLSEAQRAFCERMRQRWGNPSNQCLGLCLNRGSLFEDSVAVLGAPGAAEEYLQAHQMLQVQFEGEAGVDEGGLLREWLCIACQEGCRPDRGVFERLQAGHVWPSAVGWGVAQEEAKLVLRLLGRLVGIALASGHSIGFAVHPIFWQWAFPAAPDEEVDYFLALRHFDREQFVHRARLVCTRGQMAAALGADGEEELEVLLPGWRPLDGDEVAELELTWDYHDTVCGTPLSTPLLPEGGAAAAVTKDRAAEYLRLWSRQRIVGCVEGALATLRDGILEVVPGEALRRLTPAELGQLAAGVVDWRPEELLRHLQVVAVCDAAGGDNGGEVSRMVRQLGEVLGAFSGHQREAFLRYVTGSPCLPAGGAAALRPRPTLQVIRTWSTETLPVAHTCANMLDMPLYPDADTLRSRLLTALHFGTDGFGLA